MKFNRKKFFDGFRERLDSTIEQSQVNGIEFLLAQFENDPTWADKRHIAYALATVFHETAGSMRPVEECYYLGARAKAEQKTLRYYPYFGRGYVQLTWKTNYERAGTAFGLDLVGRPELALSPDVAFKVMTQGMFKGWFSKGNTLAKYINNSKCDYVGARLIINGTDKAGLIAGYARSFEKILTVAEPEPDTSTNLTTLGQTESADSQANLTDIPTTPPSNIVVEKEVDEGFIKKTWKKLVAWTASIGGVDTIKQNADQLSFLGISQSVMQKVVIGVVILALIWLFYELTLHLWNKVKSRWLTVALVQANTTAENTVMVAPPDKLDELQSQGWVVVRRQ